MIKRHIVSLSLGLLGGALAIVLFVTFFKPEPRLASLESDERYGRLANYTPEFSANFTDASANATPTVVHIKTGVGNVTRKYDRKYDYKRDKNKDDDDNGNDENDKEIEEFLLPFRDFFDQQPMIPGAASGSGVIISADGYIITNNHVIKGSDKIEVVLNDNRTFSARVVGADPSTDLALLKVNESNLPYIRFGNSDDLMIGEWVLAVGNPFNLTSTVTAGIVSAKARNIGILSDKYRIESFIQTDAAVNPGNSGGALVNLKGELIGVNTAIATQTGAFSGYSFAIPANIVRKVVDDLIDFGAVQRGFLGVSISDVTAELAHKEDLAVNRGAYINEVNNNSAAEDAGIKKGDVIVKVEEVKIKSTSELQEQIGRRRPGDKVKVTVLRGNDEKIFEVALKSSSGKLTTTKVTTSEIQQQLGVSLDAINEKDKKELKIENGVKVTALEAGKFKASGMPEGFIITKVDKTPVYTQEDVINNIKGKEGAILIEGYHPNGDKDAFAIVF